MDYLEFPSLLLIYFYDKFWSVTNVLAGWLYKNYSLFSYALNVNPTFWIIRQALQETGRFTEPNPRILFHKSAEVRSILDEI